MSNRAWVTLATNDSYGLGALVLANSLRRAGSAYPAVVLITPSVTEAMRDRLSAVFAEVVTVDVLDSGDAAHLALLQRPELGITFTKLHCWNLTQYEKCVFLDADTLVVQNSDELFEREELSAAPDVGWPDCFNSGVFVFRPSADTFEKLIKFAQERGSFDGGDQGLLNAFFSDWAHGDINKHLPFIFNVTSAAFYSYIPALKHYGQDLKIIHFIGAAKPWLQQFNFESRSVDAPEHLREFLQLWWDLFVSQVHPRLDTSMSGVAGNLARVVPGATGHQREALDELTRRQGWEAGNIDYMGADSFDNIWAKISQTLSRASPPKQDTPKQPSPPKELPSHLDQPSSPEKQPQLDSEDVTSAIQQDVESVLKKDEKSTVTSDVKSFGDIKSSADELKSPSEETKPSSEEIKSAETKSSSEEMKSSPVEITPSSDEIKSSSKEIKSSIGTPLTDIVTAEIDTSDLLKPPVTQESTSVVEEQSTIDIHTPENTPQVESVPVLTDAISAKKIDITESAPVVTLSGEIPESAIAETVTPITDNIVSSTELLKDDIPIALPSVPTKIPTVEDNLLQKDVSQKEESMKLKEEEIPAEMPVIVADVELPVKEDEELIKEKVVTPVQTSQLEKDTIIKAIPDTVQNIALQKDPSLREQSVTAKVPSEDKTSSPVESSVIVDETELVKPSAILDTPANIEAAAPEEKSTGAQISVQPDSTVVLPEQKLNDKEIEKSFANVPVTSEVPCTPPATPKSIPEVNTSVETTPKSDSSVESFKSASSDLPKAKESVKVIPATPEKDVVLDTSPETPKSKTEPEKSSDSSDSPPLANTPSKEEAPPVPTAKAEERRKPVGKLQLSPPTVADPLPTPDSELEDAASLATSIIASELRTPTVSSPSPTAAPTTPQHPKQEKRLSVEEPEVPTPPVCGISLEQIGVKPSKGKSSTAEQIESSVTEKKTDSATCKSSTTPAAPAEGKKKAVKKAGKDGSSTSEAPVPPPRKKEKKPKDK